MVRFPFKVLPHLPPFRASVFQVMLLEIVFVVGFRVVISIVQFPPQLHFFSGGWNHRFTALRSAVPRFSPECPSSSTVVGQDGALGRWGKRSRQSHQQLLFGWLSSCIHVFMEFHSPCVLKMCVNSLFCFWCFKKNMFLNTRWWSEEIVLSWCFWWCRACPRVLWEESPLSARSRRRHRWSKKLHASWVDTTT